MPKIIKDKDEEEEENQFEEDDDEELLIEEELPPAPVREKRRPMVAQRRRIIPNRESAPKENREVEKPRFIVFNQAQRIGIADAETGEVIAEGELLVPHILAKMMGNQELILNNLGSMID